MHGKDVSGQMTAPTIPRGARNSPRGGFESLWAWGRKEMPSKQVFCGNSNHWQTAIFGRFVESQLHLDIRYWLRVAVAGNYSVGGQSGEPSG